MCTSEARSSCSTLLNPAPAWRRSRRSSVEPEPASTQRQARCVRAAADSHSLILRQESVLCYICQEAEVEADARGTNASQRRSAHQSASKLIKGGYLRSSTCTWKGLVVLRRQPGMAGEAGRAHRRHAASRCSRAAARPPSAGHPAPSAAGSPVPHVAVCHKRVTLHPGRHLGLVCAPPDQHAAGGGVPHRAPQHQLARIRLPIRGRAGGWAGRCRPPGGSASAQQGAAAWGRAAPGGLGMRSTAHAIGPAHPRSPTHHLAAAPQVLSQGWLPPCQQLFISVPAWQCVGRG